MKYCPNCGKQVNNEDKICMHCGNSIDRFNYVDKSDRAGVITIILSFLIPLFGLVIYGANHATFPRKSRACMIAAGLGIIVNLLLYYFILQNELYLMS